jgi:hypothetical protein
MMDRLKDRSVIEMVDILRSNLKQPEWADRQQEYFTLLNGGLAELLIEAKGKDQDLQQMVAQYTAHVLDAELKVRTTEPAPRTGTSRLPGGSMPPEDRILDALASLLDDAKGKENSHQLAMVNATASITESIRRIKELPHGEGLMLGQLLSPATPKRLPASRANVKTI